MSRRRSHRQRGSVLITIMVVMMVTMLLASTLINHFAVQEARAIEQQLADIRAYWAMMGHVNYALSRASNNHNSLCGGVTCADDAARATAFNSLFTELGSARRWTYSEYGATTYYFDVQAAIDADVTTDGKLRLHMNIPAVGALESLTGLRGSDVWVDICLYNAPASCPSGLTTEEYGKSLITGVLRSTPPSAL